MGNKSNICVSQIPGQLINFLKYIVMSKKTRDIFLLGSQNDINESKLASKGDER